MLNGLHTRLQAIHDDHGRPGILRGFALALVWSTMATSGLVFSEPCPTDLGALALIVLLPALGLVRFGPTLGLILLVWCAAAAFGLLAAMSAHELTPAITHTLVSLYLYGTMAVVAGFIAYHPERHLRVIFSGLLAAGTVAAITGLAGYFQIFPGAEIFTKFERASGTFKDPNVFGPFLLPPMLYALHLALNRSLAKSCVPLLFASIFALGIFLSFSRGAWLNLIIGTSIFLVLEFVTATSQVRRRKLVLMSIAGAGLLAVIMVGALQVEKVSSLVAERASVTQSYDVGPDGRFGGQEKAVALILQHPFGIGAQQFSTAYHHEEVHNVYLSMMLNAGWAGGSVYAVVTVLTAIIGFMTALRRQPAQPFVVIAVAAFVANAIEGFVIHTDHWRHVYLLMAVIWGAATAPSLSPVNRDARLYPASLRTPRLTLA